MLQVLQVLRLLSATRVTLGTFAALHNIIILLCNAAEYTRICIAMLVLVTYTYLLYSYGHSR